MERDKAIAKAKRVQADLHEASLTLEYMEKLLKALKMHKKASETAKSALIHAQEESKALVQRSETAEAAQKALQDVVYAQEQKALDTEDELAQLHVLRRAMEFLEVRVVVMSAISNVKSSESSQLLKDLAAAKRSFKQAVRRLEQANGNLDAANAALASRQEEVQSLIAKGETHGQSLAEKCAGINRLEQRLQVQKEALAATQLNKSRVESKMQETCNTLRAEGVELADKCDPSFWNCSLCMAAEFGLVLVAPQAGHCRKFC
jgi:chromosome segregation ATPase